MTPDRFDPLESPEPYDAGCLAVDPQDGTPFPALPEHNFHVRRMTLIALLVAALVLPFLYVGIMAYSDLRACIADATDVTLRTVRVTEEHALKVFDMNETLDARVVELTDDLDDNDIRAHEAEIHEKLRSIGGGYPQVAAVSIFGHDGSLFASSCFYPVPAVSIATRDDFTGIRSGQSLENVSKVMTGHVAGEQLFNMGLRRPAPDGSFGGMVSVALRPSYFEAFYRELLGGNDLTPMRMNIVRTNGPILAHFPRSPHEPAAISPHSAVAEALGEGRRAASCCVRR